MDASELSGLELRSAVAREVMGLRLLKPRPGTKIACSWDIGTEETDKWMFHDDASVFRSMIPEFEVDIAAAWLVVERMREKGYVYFAVVANTEEWWADFMQPLKAIERASGATAAEAICRSALKAVRSA